jgi:hypothetical protein
VATGIATARFVGRGAELRRLAAASAAADAGRASFVVVGGDAGVGKQLFQASSPCIDVSAVAYHVA